MRMRTWILWGAWLLGTGTAVAAVFQVPGHYGTLQQALNAAPDGSTILVAPGTYGENLQALNLNKELYFKSTDGAAATLIDGGGTQPLLRIDSSSANPSKKITWDGFTFTRGRGDGVMAPVMIAYAQPVFLNCVFTDNFATEKAGAVIVYGNTAYPVFAHCTFTNNRSDRLAGAVLVNGGGARAVFKFCHFENNHNRTAAALGTNHGGALYFAEGGGEVYDCTFVNNRAMYAGGAVMALQWWDQPEEHVRFERCRFENNYVLATAGAPAPAPTEGGAVMAESNVTLHLTDCVFTGNAADAGGALHSYRANLNVTNCVFVANVARGTNFTGYGGAIGVNNHDSGDNTDRREGRLNLSGVVMKDNVAPVGAGLSFGGDGVYSKNAVLTMNRVIMEGGRSTTANNSYGHGGGLYLYRASATGSDVYLLRNTAEGYGGGALLQVNTSLSLTDSILAGNAAAVDAGVHIPSGDDSVFTPTGSTVLAFNGGGPSFVGARLMAAPPVLVRGTAWLAWLAAPFGDGAAITPQPGARTDLGGYTTGAVGVPNLIQATAFTLDSSQPDLVVNVPRAASRAFGAEPVLPARIEAEHFDVGGSRVAYSDTEATNLGGAYRPTEGVDLAADASASQGVLVGWTQAGEWMEYSFYAPTAGGYDVSARVAGLGGGQFYIAVDGRAVSPLLAVPNTGGWTTWQELQVQNVDLTAGAHTMRFVIVEGGFNLDWIEWSTGSTTPRIELSALTLDAFAKEGQAVAPRSISIRNSQGGTLQYNIASSQPWLRVAPTSGQSTGEWDAIGVTFDTTGLATGTYQGTLTFEDPAALNTPQTVTVTLRITPNRRARLDFDGDGRSDLGCYYPPGGNWYFFTSTEGFRQTQFGYAGTLPVVGDFDGDGKTDFGCYYPPGGNWYFFTSSGGFSQTQFGYAGTLPVVGDFDGDGKDDFGCYYPPGGNWYFFTSSGGFSQTQFGYAGTLPVVGDFDGDGKTDFGCYYPPSGNWYFFTSSGGFSQTQFGYAGTLPVVGDFDGDGRDDFGCYYPPGRNWYFFTSSVGFSQTVFNYPGPLPIVGDFDGDGRTDYGCYDPPSGNWYLSQTTGGFSQVQFGYAGTIPLGMSSPP